MLKTIVVLLLASGGALGQHTPAEQREPKDSQQITEDSIEVRDIRESSAKDVGEALTLLTGVSKVRKGGIANDVVLRGFQQDNINVQVDGARIYGACPNNMDPSASHVDFAEVDRIEILKGPFDVRNQGSLGGTIRIVTHDEEPVGLRLVPAFAHGSFGFYNPSVELSAAGRVARFALGYAYRTSAAYKDGQGRAFTSYANYRPETQDLRAFEGHSGWGSLAFSPAQDHRVEIGYSRQQNGLTLYPYLMMDATYDNADRATAKYVLRNISDRLSELRVEGYASKVNHKMTDAHRSSSGAWPYSMATHATSSALGAKAVAEMKPDVTVGIEASRRTWNALTAMRNTTGEQLQNSLPDVIIGSLGTFAEIHRELTRRLRFQAGVRFDHVESSLSPIASSPDLYFAYNNTRSEGATDNFAGGNARLSITPGGGISLFAGIGSAARVPDAQERYFALRRMTQDWVGNPALQPTRNTEVDFGILWKRRNARVQATVFYGRIDNYIALHRQSRINSVAGVMNAIAQSYANLDARMWGGEMTFALPVGKALAFSGGASMTRGSKALNPTIAVLDSDLAEMPPTKSWLNLRYGSKWFYAQLGGAAAGAQNHVDNDLSEQPSPGYAVINAKVGVHREQVNINIGVDNLLNRFYYESFSYSRDPFRSGVKIAEPGRTIFVSASFRL